LVLIAVASIAEPYAYPQFAFAGVSPFLSEVLLGFALTAGLYLLPQVRSRATGEPRAITIALALFLATAAMGVGVAIDAGVQRIDVFNSMREVVFVSAFWLAAIAMRRPESRNNIFVIVAGLAIVVVVLQVAQLVVGTSHILFYTKDYKENLITCPTGQCADPGVSSFLRVRPPGLRLVYIVAAFSACYLLFGPRRRRGIALTVLGVCLAGLILSLNRNLLVGLVLGLVVSVLVTPRKSAALVAALAIAAVVLVMIPLAQSGVLGSAAPVMTRLASIGNTAEFGREGSLKDRSIENHLALQAIRRHPLEGIGWGTSYGNKRLTVQGKKVRTTDQLFIHNMYLGLWMRAGLLGLIAFGAALSAGMLYAMRWCRKRQLDEQTWLGAGVLTSLVAISASSLVDIGSDPEKMVPLMGVLALSATLAREMRLNRD